VTHTLALEHKKLSLSTGGYDAWLRLRAAKLAQLESQRAKQDADRAHLQSFVDRFRAKASKARQAQSRVKMLEKMQEISIPLSERTVPFSFEGPATGLAPPLLELRDAELGYGEKARILKDVTLRLDPDDRVAIVGTNGQGKTTLVKSIAERLTLMGGKRLAARSLRIGYFSQDQLDELHLGETVLYHVMRALPPDTPPARQRAVAAGLGFSYEKVETKVENLSGGEKVRLLLGLMAMEKPHILILDEPTSHLDIDSREALIYALNDYPGAILLITHDVYLAEATADQLWLVKNGRVSNYDGDLEDYRALVLQADRSEAASRTTGPAAVVEETRKDGADARRQSADARKAAAPLKQKVADAEKRMEKAQARIGTIDQELARPDQPGDRVKALLVERATRVAEAERAEADWIEAGTAYELAVSR
jgi:ATP-binding cassette subfamily F protein 3